MVFILGSRNSHKLAEMSELLPGLSLQRLPENISEPVENGHSFTENARIKSESYARATGQWVIADDSGICVDALDGAPGIYSARFAGHDACDEDNNRYLLERLRGQTNREAHYVCVVSLASPEGEMFSVEGRCFGKILECEEGDKGFGYDPLFYSNDLNQSFALSEPEAKSSVSHRAVACRLFMEELQKRELMK